MFNILSSFLTPIIAIITTYIAYQQWQLRKEKLKLDLFEKRYRVYEGTKKFISIILQKGHPSESDITEFKESTHDATFLFENEVGESLTVILENANKLKNLNERIAIIGNAMSEKEKKETLENEAKIKDWFETEYNEIKYLFGKYLSFE